MSAVTASGLGVTLGGSRILTDVDLTVGAGEWVGLIGPNGAGKTTLLNTVAGLLEPADGEVALDGRTPDELGRRGMARRVALVPQQPTVPEGVTVLDYVLLGRTPHLPVLGVEGPGDLDVVGAVLRRLGLRPFAGRDVATLSGGQWQRVVLGRSLAQQAGVLLLDEPTSELDLGHRQHVLEIVDGLRRSDGLTVVSAMHDLTVAGQYADRLVLLTDGAVRAAGPPAEVLTEELLSVHYGARVRVLDTPDGLIVVPARGSPGPVAGGPALADQELAR